MTDSKEKWAKSLTPLQIQEILERLSRQTFHAWNEQNLSLVKKRETAFEEFCKIVSIDVPQPFSFYSITDVLENYKKQVEKNGQNEELAHGHGNRRG